MTFKHHRFTADILLILRPNICRIYQEGVNIIWTFYILFCRICIIISQQESFKFLHFMDGVQLRDAVLITKYDQNKVLFINNLVCSKQRLKPVIASLKLFTLHIYIKDYKQNLEKTHLRQQSTGNRLNPTPSLASLRHFSANSWLAG